MRSSSPTRWYYRISIISTRPFRLSISSPFAIGNLFGPLVLGPLFDTFGRRKMIFGTYFLAGFVLLISAYLFKEGALTATTHTLFWGYVLGAGVMIFGGGLVLRRQRRGQRP